MLDNLNGTLIRPISLNLLQIKFKYPNTIQTKIVEFKMGRRLNMHYYNKSKYVIISEIILILITLIS